MSDWWKKGVAFPSNNENFLKILNFYLFNCPVKFIIKCKDNSEKIEYVSKRAIAFETKSWSAGNVKTFLSIIKEDKHFECTDDIEGERKRIESLNDNLEYIVFKKDSRINQLKSIFYSIRNAFAHGSFSIRENNGSPLYYFENEHNGIKAQICLKESTLLNWIEIFNLSPEQVRNQRKEKSKKRKNKNSTTNSR